MSVLTPDLTQLLPRSAGRLSRRPVAAPAAPVPAISTPFAPVPLLDADARQELVERRAQALRSMFPKLYSVCARRADLWRAIATERYLSKATNVADLEQRIHEVQRQRHFG